METILAFIIGALYAAGLYMMMRRSIFKIILGLSILGHAANLLIFTASGVTAGRPPVIPDGSDVLAAGTADPVPQALILTAIVIGFGVLAFTIVLIKRGYDSVGTDDLDAMKSTDV